MNYDIGVKVATMNSFFHQVNNPKEFQHKSFLNFQVNFPIRESFKQTLRKHYGEETTIVPVDFTNRPRTTLRIMNK